MLVDVPLPGLSVLPEMNLHGVTGTYVERQDYIHEQVNRVKAIAKLRAQLRDVAAATRPREPLREVVVTFRVEPGRVGAVVEWRVLGVGGMRVLRRVDGALRVQPRTVRDVGPGVALLVLIRALTKALEGAESTED